jgi:hypothetical protein
MAQQYVDDAILEAADAGQTTTNVVDDMEYIGSFPDDIRDIISMYNGDVSLFPDDQEVDHGPGSSYGHRRLLPKRSDFGEGDEDADDEDSDKDKKQMISNCRNPSQVETMTRSNEQNKTSNDAVINGQVAEENKHDNNDNIDPDTPASQVPQDTEDAFDSEEDDEQRTMLTTRNDIESKYDVQPIPNVISNDDADGDDAMANIRAILEATGIPSGSIDWLMEEDLDVETLRNIAKDLQKETKPVLPEFKQATIYPVGPIIGHRLGIGLPVAQPVKDRKDRREEQKRQQRRPPVDPNMPALEDPAYNPSRRRPRVPVQPASWYHPHMPQYGPQPLNPGFDPNGRRIVPPNPRINPRGGQPRAGGQIDWRATREAVGNGINTIIRIGDRLAPIADDIKRGDAIATETERLRRSRQPTSTQTDSPTDTQTTTRTETQKLADSVDTLNPVYGRGRAGAGGFGNGYRPDGTDFLPYVFPESHEIRNGSQLMKNSVQRYFQGRNQYGTGGEVLQNMMYI